MRYCTNCGKQLDEDAEFCGECGQRVVTIQQPQQNTAGQENMAQSQEQPQQHQVYPGPIEYRTPQYADPNDEKPLSTSQWFLTIFLLGLPIAGFVLSLVWAFGDGGNKSRKNFCRAQLIWLLIATVILIILLIILIPLIIEESSHSYTQYRYYKYY